jgi:hypothetical protein
MCHVSHMRNQAWKIRNTDLRVRFHYARYRTRDAIKRRVIVPCGSK